MYPLSPLRGSGEGVFLWSGEGVFLWSGEGVSYLQM